MKFPWLDLFLLVVILLGAISAWRSGTGLADMRREYDRLKLITGDLEVTDPSKIYVRALPTDDKLEFAWRIYLPANYRLYVHDGSGSSSWGSASEARHDIIRVRLQKIDGYVYIYHQMPNSSGLGGNNSAAAELIRDRLHELDVEQLGKNKTEELDPAQEFTLLRLKLSESLQREAEVQKIKDERMPTIYGVYIGPPSKMP